MSKAQFEIRTTAAGHEVIRFEPVTLGTFDEKEHARMFLDALTAGKPAQTVRAPASSLAPEHRPPPFDPTPVADTNPSPVARPEPPTAKLAMRNKSKLPAVALFDPDEADWQGALKQIAAGKRVKDVAEAMGLPFGQLRSKWAIAIRLGTHQKPDADDPVSGGVGSVLARGRPVKRSPEAHDRDVAKLMGRE